MSNIDFSGVEKRILDGMSEQDVPSIAVAVARQGEIIWEAGYGLADKASRLESTAHIAYPLASVTKTITATAVMRLVELGKLDLDKPINHYLPSGSQLRACIGDAEELTVRRVANHTSGLTALAGSYGPTDRAPMPSWEESIRRYGMAVTVPGERYRYSNGFSLLAYLVTCVSGQSFADFAAREIFAPLGMSHSAIGLSDRLAGAVATRYDDDGQPIPAESSSRAGASGAYASAHDLVRFGLFHLKQPLGDQQRILSDAALDEMHRPTAVMGNVPPSDFNLHPGSCYGVGWVIDPDLSPRRISHGGGIGGGATKLLLLPDEQIVIAVVSNKFKPLAYTLENDILDAVLPDYTRPVRVPIRPVVETDGAALLPLRGEWVGQIDTYEGPMEMTMSFLECGCVHAKVGSLQPKTLVNDIQFKDGWFSGAMAGMIETLDANRFYRYPIHHLKLELKLRDNRLTGAVICVAGVYLGHWVDLRRVEENSD